MGDVDSLESSREPVRIAFTPYLSNGDDIETGALIARIVASSWASAKSGSG
jgi:hypothetical protein